MFANRAIISQCKSTAFNSMWAIEWSIAIWPFKVFGRRRGTSPALTSSGLFGRAGFNGGFDNPISIVVHLLLLSNQICAYSEESAVFSRPSFSLRTKVAILESVKAVKAS